MKNTKKYPCFFYAQKTYNHNFRLISISLYESDTKIRTLDIYKCGDVRKFKYKTLVKQSLFNKDGTKTETPYANRVTKHLT